LRPNGSCKRCEHTGGTQDYGKKSRHGLGLSSAEDKRHYILDSQRKTVKAR
jgi:hypothetical protein